MVSNTSRNAVSLLIFRPTMGQGGADRVTLTLLRELDRRIFRLSLVLARHEGEFINDIPPDVPIYSLNTSSLLTASVPLIRLLRTHRPDIFLSTSSGANVVAVIAHKLSGQTGRLVLSERSVLLRGHISLKKKMTLWLKRLLYGQADHIMAVSQGVKDDLIQRLGLPAERISVVYNPIVTDQLSTMAMEKVEHPWFADGIPVILGVGRLVPEKDFAGLIEAFAQVRAGRKMRLVILGEGPLKTELIALARRRGIEEDVWLTGFDKNPFKYMSRCTVFVLSSRFEGLPGVLIQAMACGAPVISTDCPSGPSEIIQPDVDGILVSVGDVDALAERMGYLLDHPELRMQFSAAARQSVRKFAADVLVRRHADILLGHYDSRG